MKRGVRQPESLQPSGRRHFFRLAIAAFTTVAAVAGGLAATAAPASAGTCSSKTGGSSNTLMWTGSTYTCAYVSTIGNSSINAWQTKSWTSSTASGYKKKYNCTSQTGGVTITNIYTDSGGTNLGSSITYTAFNSADGKRHWTAANLWYTNSGGSPASDQYNHGCSGYTVYSNLMYKSTISVTGPASVNAGQSANFNVTVSNPDGGPSPSGMVAIYLQASNSSKQPITKNCSGQTTGGKDVAIGSASVSGGKATVSISPQIAAGSYNLYGVYSGMPTTSSGLPSYCLTPPQSGLTPAMQSGSLAFTVNSSTKSATAQTAKADVTKALSPRGDIVPARLNPQLRIVNVSAVTPASPSAACPGKRAPVQASSRSTTEAVNDDAIVRGENGKLSMNVSGIPDGTQIDLQLVCRPIKANAMTIGGAGYGSVRADKLVTQQNRSFVFGGFGNDVILVKHARGLGIGGPGSDRIVLSKNQSAANGGPGNDKLVANSRGKALLVGGPGQDVLIGGFGPTLINAQDGRADKVVCRSNKTKVLADSNDELVGPCQRLT